MSTGPINGIGTKPNSSVTGLDEKSIIPNSPAPETKTDKPALKPPLERPFSLSLPPEQSAAQTIVKNIDESNKETEKLTKKSADEAKLKEILQEKQAQDQLLNGPGPSGV